MIMKFGTQLWGVKPYKVCSNDDPELTMTFFKARSNLPPNAFVWENAKTLDVIETIEVSELKVATKWVHECIWVPEVKVIVWPLSKVSQIYAF